MSMELDGLLKWIFDTTLASAVRENDWLFPTIESVHVLAVTVFLGSIVWVDLTILKLANQEREPQRVAKELLPITWVMFFFALVSGLVLFTSNAVNYAHNIFFQFKMLLLLFAGLNMVVFQTAFSARALPQSQHLFETTAHLKTRDLKRAHDDTKSAVWSFLRSGQWSALISFLIWLSVIVLGRWIGFSIQPTFVS